jgi:hypothetical protein
VPALKTAGDEEEQPASAIRAADAINAFKLFMFIFSWYI